MSVESVAQRQAVRRFSLIWSAQAVSLLGSNLVGFALVWYLTDLTGSAIVLVVASLMNTLPQIVLSPLAGVLTDRWNRRAVMIGADSFIALNTLLLAWLFYVDAVAIWHIYVVMFIRATAGGFHWAAMQASTSLMLPEEHLSRVNGFNQLLNGAMLIVAPPLGALLLDILPLQSILGMDVLTALIAITPLLFIAIPQPERDETGTPASVLADLREGFAFVWAWRGLRIILFMSMGLNFLILPGMAVLPLLATEHFDGGALQLAWLEASFGLGMIAGGLTLGLWGGFRDKIFTGMLGIIGLGIGLLIVAASPPAHLWIGLMGLLFASACNALAGGSLFSLLQVVVPADKQGRVFTMLASGGSLMVPISLGIAGPLVEVTGVLTWFLFGGIAALTLGVMGLFIPALRAMQTKAEVEIKVEAEAEIETHIPPVEPLPETL